MQILPHSIHLSSQQLRALRIVPGAARRGGGRGSSSDGMRNSGWQDRLYSAGDAPDSSSSTRGQQRNRGGSKHTRRDSRDRAAAPYTPGSGSSSQQQPYSRSSELSDAGSSDFVVIKKGSAGSVGSYIPTTQELQVQEDELDGSRYWDAAIQDFDDEDEDDEGEWEDEGELDGEDEGVDEDEDVEVEEVISLLQELAAGLEDEEAGLLDDEGTTSSAADASEPGAAVGHEQQQQQGAVDAAVEWRQSYLGSSQPPLTLGPVCVKDTAGKGRGLFTTSAVSAGEVLLVGAPLVLLWSEEGTTPENEELAEHLVAAVAATAAAPGSSSSKGLSPWQQQALLQLRPPGGQTGQQRHQQQQVLPDLRQLLGPPEEPVKQQQQQPTVQQLPDAEALTQVVFANCTGEEFEDQALVLLRGATSCGHLGVWPAAALINHSCAPNCHAMLLGDRLVVRAAHDIPAAAEVTLSYLGPQLFAPAAERQAELKQQWGFDCSCSRCKAEARYAGSRGGSSSLAQELQSAYSRCQQLSPELDVAVDEEDVAALRGIQQELLGLQASLEASIRTAKPPANVRRWLQASVYDLYDLLSLAADQVPPPPPKASRGRGGKGRGRGASSSSSSRDMPAVETEALATCARIVGEVTPGSSAHVELATEYMVRTEARFGSDHQESADASRLCAAAITTRYAPISDGMLQLLMDTWAGAALL